MAPTGSDGTTTDLADPDTANPSPGDASGGSTTPFGDWREQLRERVKEIRARKHVADADVEELALDAPAYPVSSEKLELARVQSLQVPRTRPDDSPLAEEPRVQLVEGARDGRRAEIAGLVDDLVGAPQDSLDAEFEQADGDTEPEDPVQEASPAPDVAPLFQEESTVFVDDPILEIADEFEPRARRENEDTEAEAEVAAEAEVEVPAIEAPAATEQEAEVAPAAGAETRVDEIVQKPPSAAADLSAFADTPLVDSIPPELRDVEIPTWALPREPSRAPQVNDEAGEVDGIAEIDGAEIDAVDGGEIDEADGGADDTFLVGEYTTPEGGKRTDLGPPPETPIPTAEMLDKPIGDLSALSEETPSSDGPTPEEPHSEETLEIAPPGALVDAADFEPSSREEAPAASRSLPGLFDIADESGDEEASRPGLFFDKPLARDAEEESTEPTVEDIAAPVHSEVVAAREKLASGPFLDEQDGGDEPRDAAGEASGEAPGEGDDLQWDVDTDLDAEMVAEARRQHVDSSAPLSDRVYSAVADGLVLLTIGLVLMIAGASAAGAPIVPFVLAAPVPFLAAWLLFGLVYGVIFVGTCGQTVGKMAMRVRVIGADTFRVGYGRAALRALAYAAAALPAGLGLLTAIKDPEHRGVHDRLTSTRVVKA